MDKLYWEKYYQQEMAPEEPSRFALYIADEYVAAGRALLELGCGNGRDARFFGSYGTDVTAIDQASAEIKELSAGNRYDNIRFLTADFTRLEETIETYDIVYSRFTLHSVSLEEQHRTLQWSQRALKIGGYLCIEVRGQENSLFGKGQPVDDQPDAFIYNDHYRRFLEKDALDREVADLGLDIITSTEAQGYAPFGGQDDFFIRQISQKTA